MIQLKKKFFRFALKGFSIVEVSLGIFLLALVLIPSLYVLISGTGTIAATRDHSVAAFMAHRILETIKSYDFDHIATEQWKFNPTEQKNTLEWDLLHDSAIRDRIKIEERLNYVIYKLTNPSVQMVYPTNSASAALALISFNIEYLDKKKHETRILPVFTALARQGTK